LIKTEFVETADLSLLQQRYATDKKGFTLTEAIKGADVFLGLSAGNVLSAEMLLTMIILLFCNGKSSS
jgi:malate dehydrogenase (oxaloacetate-decarboxylating)(NADP+)